MTTFLIKIVLIRIVCNEIMMAANVQQWPVTIFRVCYANCMVNVTLVGGGGEACTVKQTPYFKLKV